MPFGEINTLKKFIIPFMSQFMSFWMLAGSPRLHFAHRFLLNVFLQIKLFLQYESIFYGGPSLINLVL